MEAVGQDLEGQERREASPGSALYCAALTLNTRRVVLSAHCVLGTCILTHLIFRTSL